MKNMIERYEIRKVDKEEILVLYLSYDYEFSDFERHSLLNKVNDFVSINKIKWKGNKVILVVGGLILGSVVLGRIDIPPYKYDNNFHYVSQIILNHYNNDNIQIGYSKIEPKEPIILTGEKKVTNYSAIVNDNKPITKVVNTSATVAIPIYVKRSNGIMVTIDLEDYVLGVIGAEMSPLFPLEALKAQAIAARTYALKYLQDHAYLTDDNTTQIYKDNIELLTLWKNNYNTYYRNIKDAVTNTRGVVLTYDNDLITALYHAISNGYTESSYEVFGKAYPYLTVVSSTWDTNARDFMMEQYISFEDLSYILNIPFNQGTTIEIINRDLSGRITSLRVDDNYFSGVEFRKLLGLRSTDFSIEFVDDGIIVTTKGYGHGVGMSQYGALEMANNGSNYQEILAHYYPGTELKIVKSRA